MAEQSEITDRVESLIIDTNTAVLAEIDGLLNKAQVDAEDRRGLRIFEAAVTHTLTNGTSYTGGEGLAARFDVPSDWNGIQRDPFVDNNDGTYTPMSAITMSEFFSMGHDSTNDLGKPKYWFLQNEDTTAFPMQACYYPEPDNEGPFGSDPYDYHVIMPYWRRLATLTADDDENWLSINAEDYLVWKTAAYAFEFNRDLELAGHYFAKAEAEYRRLRKAEISGQWQRGAAVHPAPSAQLGSRNRLQNYKRRRIQTDWPPAP